MESLSSNPLILPPAAAAKSGEYWEFNFLFLPLLLRGEFSSDSLWLFTVSKARVRISEVCHEQL
jgi:hypothetical protein